MTKFLVYTDTHLTGQRPVHRCDDFIRSILDKMKETYDLAKQNNVDFVVFLGDFYNNHRIFNYEIINEAMDIIDSHPTKTYAIIGQHDLRGYNLETYKTSTLNFMERHCGNFETIFKPLEFNDVVLYPCHVYEPFPEVFKNKITRKKKSILLAHHLITLQKKPFPTHIINDYLPCQYSAILFGDFHVGMEPYYDSNETLIWSPGSLTRLAINDIERKIKIGIITTELGSKVLVEEIHLASAKSGYDVFSKNVLEIIRETPQMVDMDGFIKGIQELETMSIDIYDMIEKAAKNNGIRQEVINYILSKKSEKQTI